MMPEIRPLQPDDLEELSRLLAEGFHAPAGAPFCAPEVLSWKYLDPDGGAMPRSFVACNEGTIIGHVGVWPGHFQGGPLPPEGITTLHMTDWLGARTQRSVGAALMRHAHLGAETQFVLIANDQARRVTQAAGYAPVAEVPVFQKVLRAGYRWKRTGQGPAARFLRVAKDTVRALLDPEEAPQTEVALRPVTAFGAEINPILDDLHGRAISTGRAPARLNHALRCPCAAMTGWLIEQNGRIAGLALLSVLEQDGVRSGKIVECLVERDEADVRHAAVTALTAELRNQGAGVAQTFASTPARTDALRRSGFVAVHRLELTLRDRDGRIPSDPLFHVSPFEADYAYF